MPWHFAEMRCLTSGQAPELKGGYLWVKILTKVMMAVTINAPNTTKPALIIVHWVLTSGLLCEISVRARRINNKAIRDNNPSMMVAVIRNLFDFMRMGYTG